MVENIKENPLDKVSETLKWINANLSDLQTKVIDNNLDKLEKLWKLPDLISKVNTVLNVNLFGLWSVSSLLGVKIFDISKYKDPNNILNIVLKKYGGIEWLHRSYIQNTLTDFLTDQPEKIDTISSLYETYKNNKQQNICSNILQDPDSLNIVCGLWMTSQTPTTITDKIPSIKFSYLSTTIYDWIEDKKQYLDPVVLAELWYNAPTKQWSNETQIIDEASPDRKPDRITKTMIEKYIIKKTTDFVKTEWYISYIPTADHFTFALMGWLFVAGNVFPEAVLLGIQTPEDFSWWKHDRLPENYGIFSGKIEDMTQQAITDELLKFKSPITEKMVMDSAKKYAVPMSYIMAMMKNDSGYGTQWLAVTTHNPGNVGNMDDGSMKDWWTREAWVDAVAENLQWRTNEYQKVYGKETFPSLKELASNVGSDGKWFLSSQGNYLQDNSWTRAGAYMTADWWPNAVQNYQNDLSNEPDTQLT